MSILVFYYDKIVLSKTNVKSEGKMFKNRTEEGKNNLCGARVAELRKLRQPKMSQRMLADLLQLGGLDVDKNAIQRIENGKRFVTDIELNALAVALGVSCEELLR